MEERRRVVTEAKEIKPGWLARVLTSSGGEASRGSESTIETSSMKQVIRRLVEIKGEASEYGNAIGLEVESEDIGQGQGFLGRVLRLHLRLPNSRTSENIGGGSSDDAGMKKSQVVEGSVIAKLLPDADSDIWRGFAQPLRLLEREAAFYNWANTQSFLASPSSSSSTTSRVVPWLYHSEVNEEGRGVVILEDINERCCGEHQARVVDFKIGLNLAQAHRALSTLAAVHAPLFTPRGQYLSMSSSSRPSWLPHVDPEQVKQIFGGLFAESFAKLKERAPGAFPNKLWEAIEKVNEASEETSATNTSMTLCNGDMWSSNLLYYKRQKQNDTKTNSAKELPQTEEEEEVVLIDWQFASWDNPLNDVAFLLFSSLDTELRRSCEGELLQHYHGCLLDRLLAAGRQESAHSYPFTDCIADWKVAKRAALVQLIDSIDIFGPRCSEGGDEPLFQRLLLAVEDCADVLHWA